MGLTLQAVDVVGPYRWRWLLVDESSGVTLTEHLVELDPGAAETEAFEDLYRFLRWRADPVRRVISEAELVRRVGAWIGAVVLGERIGQAIAAAAPVTVRVAIPPGAEFLAFRPLELAHIGGMPVAAQGEVALVYDLPGPNRSVKVPVGAALRILAVFSLPTASLAPGLRRERYELPRLVHRVATRGRRQVQLRVAHYGATRQVLAELAQSADGWDVIHLSGHGVAGEFLLANPDGTVDPVPTAELIELLRPARQRLKLAVVSSCQSAAVTTAETLHWLGLDDATADLETQAALETTATPMALARALVAQLDCAVVATRYPVTDEFTAGFAEAFYGRVFRSIQPLDRAVAAAVRDAARPAPSSARPAISVATRAIFGASAIGLSLAAPVGKPVLEPADEAMARFPPEPARFVGRTEAMATASAALAPASGCTSVVFQGLAGAGKSTCAVELAYRHRHAFTALAFWSAPTDPDQLGDALRLLAVALEAQLGKYGFAMVDQIAAPESLEHFLAALTAVLTETELLLVLDNLDPLLTPDGQWRDHRWVPLIGALTGHEGSSRVILTSRIGPAGLNSDTVLVQPMPLLSRDESLLLVRELPNLRAVLHPEAEPGQAPPDTADPALGRRVLTLTQGHPMLLTLANAAAADAPRLALQLAEIDTAVDGSALTAFLTEGGTRLDAVQLGHIVTKWTTHVATTLPAPARLLLQMLCRIEETDRSTAVLVANWADLWRRLDQPGEPPPIDSPLAALSATALIAADPTDNPADPNAPVHYRIHPSITEIIHAATPKPVIAAVDAQLLAWWNVVGGWGIQQEQTGKDTSKLVVQASLAAARYLMRQHDWNAANCLLERTLMRYSYPPAMALAAIPALRRIAEATGALKDLVVLAAALRKVDPAEAETLLRRAYEQAATTGDHRLASTTCGDLIALLRDQDRLREALTLVHHKIEHSNQAGFGRWTRMSDQGRRLQLLSLLGRHEQVLTDLTGLRAQMADLPDQRADNDRVNPWNVREGVLDVGRCSAAALARWEEALELNDEIAGIKRRRNASPYEIARTRFNNYLPLFRLSQLADLEHLLRDCQDIFDTAGDTAQLAAVYAARAVVADQRGSRQEAAGLQRISLRLWYVRLDPREIAAAHHHLADYLSRAAGEPAEQRAHRLTALLLHHLTGDACGLTRTLEVLAGELGSDTGDPTAPALPTTLSEITRRVDADNGVRFGTLLGTLCPGTATAEQTLTELVATVMPDTVVR